MPEALPQHKHHSVYLVLREQLEEGRFADGMPGELALVQQFGVARVTLRRALARLAQEGLIVREAGRRTRPVSSAAPASASPTRLSGLLENLVSMGARTRIEVLECKAVTASQAVAEALGVPAGEAVHKAVRVRSSAEGPVSHITTWVPLALGRHFGRRDLAREPILRLLEQAGVKLGPAVQTVSARLADAGVAARLDVPVGAALLQVYRLVRDRQGRPVLWLHGLYRPDRYQYRMQLSDLGRVDTQVWVSDRPASPPSE